MRVVYEVSKELARMGHDVTIYTNEIEKDRQIHVDGVNVCYFRCIKLPLIGNFNIHISLDMYNTIRENITKFDVVHLHECRGFPHIYIWRYCQKYNIPYVIQTDGALPKAIVGQSIYIKIIKYIYDFALGDSVLHDAAKLIAVSKEEANYAKKLDINSGKIVIIYCGMDVQSFNALPLSGSCKLKYNVHGKLILYLGRLSESKGIDFILKAFSELSKEYENITLIIAGPDYGYKSKIQKFIIDLDLKEKVKLIGFVEDSEKLALYVDADLFIHTVRYMGGVGIAPLEAILCNTPCIVTDECGEIIKESNSGFCVNYGDITELKEQMKFVLNNPEIGKRMASNGRTYIQKNLTWDKVVRQIEEVYKEVI